MRRLLQKCHVTSAGIVFLACALALGCAGKRRVVLDPQRLPVNTLAELGADVEIVRTDGSKYAGQFSGASDSLLLLAHRNIQRTEPLDSLAYVTYLYAEKHRAKQYKKGFLRGVGIGLLDAAILTLIYSQADNDVNKNTLFAATALSSAIPLTIYFTIEAGQQGRELDDKEFADISGRFQKELR